ncbi:MAG: GAF domain-containing protein [Deltaproteobacteria bacterium]|nr:GAF domain-containing protein [Deltaproteobacteria bacterium]
MNLKRISQKISIESHRLRYRLSIVFALFFLAPIIGFLYFAQKYDFLNDLYLPLYFIILLFFSLFGFVLLRKMFDDIRRLSQTLSKTVADEIEPSQILDTENEVQSILSSFQTIGEELRSRLRKIEKKSSEIETLKELSDLCHLTFNTEDLLYITLDRAMKLTNADVGSAMVLEKGKREVFSIEACIGLEGIAKKGDRVNFSDSIAKYAVMNKSPLLVENIETDIRFGRASRPQYSTKSFVCMPMKTLNDVIGVITLSRRKAEAPFTQADVDVLIPLLSNASFTYDNLRLVRESEENIVRLRAMKNIYSFMNSSLRGSEFLHAILIELKPSVLYESAIVMAVDEEDPDRLFIVDFITSGPTSLVKGSSYPHSKTVLGKAIKHQSPIYLDEEDLEILPNHYVQTALLTPLVVEGKTAGLLMLCDLSSSPSESQQEIINSVGEALSWAIEKERLLLVFARRNQEMETLRQIGSALAASTFDMDKVLQHTMDMIQAVMNVEAGSVLLLHGNELEFETVFNINVDVKKLKDVKITLGEGIAGYAAARGEPVISRNVKNSKHFSPAVDRITGFETRSILCVPLISQGRVLGVIEVLNKKPGEFNEDDLHLLQSLGTTVSIAMENARLYGETLAMAENERAIRNMFQKFVPKQIVEKIVIGDTSEKPMIDEFKTLTLMNIDIRGYSELSKAIGPQKTVAILNYFFSTMGEIVFKHQGIVDKYLGDGFLALFGAPVSTPLDADNAVSAALEMQQAMTDVNDFIMRQYDKSLTMGISIHTGEVVVGNIGFDKKMDYTVIGDSVNAVFRLQALCKPWPNGILISEKTFQAIQSPVDVEEIGTCETSQSAETLRVLLVKGRDSTPAIEGPPREADLFL